MPHLHAASAVICEGVDATSAPLKRATLHNGCVMLWPIESSAIRIRPQFYILPSLCVCFAVLSFINVHVCRSVKLVRYSKQPQLVRSKLVLFTSDVSAAVPELRLPCRKKHAYSVIPALIGLIEFWFTYKGCMCIGARVASVVHEIT